MPKTQGPPTKEAVVFILDSFPTMNEPHPTVKKEGSHEKPSTADKCPTRLDCAKRALEGMLADMMLNAQKGSLTTVIVTKTKRTENHIVPADLAKDEMDFDSFPYSNLIELRHEALKYEGIACMRFPDAALIRDLWNVEPVKSMEEALAMKGDICDAICLAADCLHQMTTDAKGKPKRFRRKIVLLTDAGHPIVLDMPQILHIVDILRAMDQTPIHVLGLGFGQPTVEYEVPLDASAAIKQEAYSPNKRVKKEEAAMELDDNEPAPDQARSGMDEPIYYRTLQDREKLLASLTEKTGGSVVSIADMQELLDAKAGKLVVRASPRNSNLHLGPGLTVPVKILKLQDVMGNPKISERAVMLNTQGAPECDEQGIERLGKLENQRSFFMRVKTQPVDEENKDRDAEEDEDLVHIPVEDLIDAVPYGKDLIPYGQMEKAGLKAEEDCGYEDDSFNVDAPYIHILGYVEQSEIPFRFMVGPPYGISGGFSRKVCSLVAGLARTLDKAGTAAMCTIKFSSNGNCVLACLLPLSAPDRKESPPNHLVLFKLPFEDDAKIFQKPSFDEFLNAGDDQEQGGDGKKTKEQTSDDLVDALMLPDDALCCEKIASPFHTSFNKSILNRAVWKTNDLVVVREESGNEMSIPLNVLEQAKPALEAFRRTFPLKKKKVFKANKKGKAPTFRDFLDEER